MDTFGDPLIKIDPVTGQQTVVANLHGAGGTVADLTRDPVTGAIYFPSTSNHALYRLALDGSVGQMGNTTWDSSIVMHGLQWDWDNGVLYGESSTQYTVATLYTVDVSTGAATEIGPMGPTGFSSLGFDPDNHTMYSTTVDTLYTVDVTTGVSTQVAMISGGPFTPSGMAYDTDNHTMYAVDNTRDALYTLDLTTGVATQLSTFQPTGDSNVLSLVYLPVPEPASLACLGLGALALMRRRRRR
ncbi:MAG TPA: PEP-CTERM sorting domain-containing protein [Fimbriimonadaceae bacterium]|nr:PEP-CTERM sorting domain-containing protein [Fimbriimonadaceae bacterium]